MVCDVATGVLAGVLGAALAAGGVSPTEDSVLWLQAANNTKLKALMPNNFRCFISSLWS
jgi:hypothetical protein